VIGESPKMCLDWGSGVATTDDPPPVTTSLHPSGGLGWPSIRPKQAAQKIGAAHADVTVNLLLHIRGTLRFILTRYSEDFLKEAEASAVRESRAISSETQMGAAAGYERLAWRIGGG
jgi:hypothetical protein